MTPIPQDQDHDHDHDLPPLPEPMMNFGTLEQDVYTGDAVRQVQRDAYRKGREDERAEGFAVPDGYALVPVEAKDSVLRPFYECPPDELAIAWQAALLIAAKLFPHSAPETTR